MGIFKVNGALTVRDIVMAGSRIGDYGETTRIIITPRYHTGGPWYINSYDPDSNAYINFKYGSDTLIRIRHDGNIQFFNNITSTAFIKSGSSDSYVLLGGGGHKLESSLNVNSATYLAKNAGTSTMSVQASSWNGSISEGTEIWREAFKDTAIGSDTGDLVLKLRAGQYTSGGTELCMCIDGDYYAMGKKVIHAGNYTSYLGYWANIPVSASANSSTSPTFAVIHYNGETRLTSGSSFSFLTSTAGAAYVYTAGLLCSHSYLHSSRIPSNGIYSLGGITSDSTITSTYYGPAFHANISSGGWAYMRLTSGSYFWDLAASSSYSSGNLEFRYAGGDSAKVRITTAGWMQIYANGCYLQIGPQNSGWTHYQSNANHYFSPSVCVDGNMYPYTNNTRTCGTSSNAWNKVYSYGFYHSSYGSSSYVLTSDGGAKAISSLSVGNADTVDGLHHTAFTREASTQYNKSDGTAGWMRIAEQSCGTNVEYSISNSWYNNECNTLTFIISYNYYNSTTQQITVLSPGTSLYPNIRIIGRDAAVGYIEVYVNSSSPSNTYYITSRRLSIYGWCNLYSSYTAGSGTVTREISNIDNSLGFCATGIARADELRGTITPKYGSYSSVTSIDPQYNFVYATISSNQTIGLSSVPPAGREVHCIIYASGGQRTVTLPNSGSYKSLSGTSLVIASGSYGEINMISNGSTIFIRAI